jgi:AraC family transcriptional regulator
MPTVDRGVAVQPGGAVERHASGWDGIVAEVVQSVKHERLEFHYRGPRHLLVAYERGTRSDGDTFVEGLPRSKLHDMARKLTFVPAGCAYHEWHEPSSPLRLVCFHFDPARLSAPTRLMPRLFFEDATLSDTALKLRRLIDNTDPDDLHYGEALGTVLAHEVVRQTAVTPRGEALAKGGLSGWQQRVVTAYIEEHLAEPIPLGTLARLAHLSPYYFCRAFKRSLGLPPHRYHSNRRIEHAKLLLAEPAASVTDIGRIVGYGETSSFTTAFHKATGVTPTAYRRALTSSGTVP